jgi:hypothetical protein
MFLSLKAQYSLIWQIISEQEQQDSQAGLLELSSTTKCDQNHISAICMFRHT